MNIENLLIEIKGQGLTIDVIRVIVEVIEQMKTDEA